MSFVTRIGPFSSFLDRHSLGSFEGGGDGLDKRSLVFVTVDSDGFPPGPASWSRMLVVVVLSTSCAAISSR